MSGRKRPIQHRLLYLGLEGFRKVFDGVVHALEDERFHGDGYVFLWQPS